MRKWIKAAFILVAVAVCIAALFLFSVGDADGEMEKVADAALTRKHSENGKVRLRGKKKMRSKTERGRKSHKKDSVARRAQYVPSADEHVDDEKNLTAEYRKVLDSIRAASDFQDKKALVRIVQNLQKTKGWPQSVPLSLRREAIESLKWIGSFCLPEALGFLADPDEDIRESAMSQFSDAVSDFDISDTERASIMLMAAQVITDSDTMDSILFELNNMRNSVAANTIKQLWSIGNDTTQKLLPDAIQSVTGESGINTPDKIDAWLKENPDDEGDAEFYGGVSQDS